jgi:hypothetical protein
MEKVTNTLTKYLKTVYVKSGLKWTKKDDTEVEGLVREIVKSLEGELTSIIETNFNKLEEGINAQLTKLENIVEESKKD